MEWESGDQIDGGFPRCRANDEAPTAAPGAKEAASEVQRCLHGKSQDEACEQCVIDSEADESAPAREEWPSIPGWMENPLVFRDANLGIVLVADRGEHRDQWIYRIHGSTPRWCWVSVRKVDERDGFQLVDALNLPAPVSLPPVTVEAREVASGDSPDGQHPAQGLVGAARPGHASPAAPGTGSTGPKNPDRSAPEPPARVAFTQPSVNEIPDAKLIERAVRNSRPRNPGKSPRWHAVSVVFALGSTFAMELCRKYGVDPHEQIEGPVCETCAESAAGDR